MAVTAWVLSVAVVLYYVYASYAGMLGTPFHIPILLLALAFPVLFYAWVYRFSGFGLQPRHVMPVLTLIPVISGEVLFRGRHRIPRAVTTIAPSALVLFFAGYQLYAWYMNAASNAGASQSSWFFSAPVWSPPGGWTLWGIVAVCGAVAIFASSGSAIRLRHPPARTSRQPAPA